MNETHVNGIYQLSNECFTIPWSLDSINNELNNPLAKYVIAEDLLTSEVIGFVGVWIIAGEGDITNIAVSPKYRKQGIASNLLIKLFDVLKILSFFVDTKPIYKQLQKIIYRNNKKFKGNYDLNERLLERMGETQLSVWKNYLYKKVNFQF